jgi:hypothetical protein
MRLLEIWDRDLAFAALRDEMREITALVRAARQRRAVKDVMKAEKRLIAAQVNARLLRVPIKVLGSGQVHCKGEREPYSLVKPSAPQPFKGEVTKSP